MQRKGEISAWQVGMLLFVLMFANKVMVLPSLLSEKVKMEAFFVPIVMFLIDFAVLFLFFFLKKKHPNDSFFDVVKMHFGKAFAVFLYILFIVFFMSKTILLYNVSYIFLRNLIYRDASSLLFLFCVLPVVNFLAFSGLRPLGRTIQIFFPIIVLIVTICLVIGGFGINSSMLLFQTPASSVFVQSLKYVGSFGDTLVLFLFMDKINIQKKQWKVIFSLEILGMLFVVGINLIFILSYTYTSFLHPFAIFELMSFVKEYEGLGRIDIISVVLIIVLVYFHLSIYLKGVLCAVEKPFPKFKSNYSIVLYDVLVAVLSIFVFFNLGRTIIFGESVLPYCCILPLVIVPAVCIIAITKKRGNDERFSA